MLTKSIVNGIFIIMVQILKNNIRQSIVDAALKAFADRGYSNTSMAEIAKRSGVSTGNVYRYFENKEKLFNEVIPESFVETFLEKLRKRIDAYPIGMHPLAIPEDSSYHVFSKDLLDFVISNRMQILILLEGSEGTKHDLFFKKLAIELANKLMNVLQLNATDNVVIIQMLIEKLYENYLQAVGTALRQFSQSAEITSSIRYLSAYHLGGLANLIKSIEEEK